MKTLLLLVGLLVTWENKQVLGDQALSDRELQELSTEGSKYINKEIKNALKEVKQIKSLIEHTNDERKSLLGSLEEAKKQKEDALTDTKETEMKLKASEGVCNESMMALWEECKPCLKQTCMKFYARVCRSGSGPVGRQLEEFLNQSSPFYLWSNGDRIDSLLENDRQQTHVLDAMENRFKRVSSIMDELFQDRFFSRESLDTPYFSSFGSSPRRSLFFSPRSRFARNIMPFSMFRAPNFQELNSSLQLAEKFSKLYDELFQSYQQKMLNTSFLLKQLNEQFNWVSQLANLTQGEEPYSLQVTTVASHSSDSSVPTGFTKVVLKLFDSDPITVTVPEVSWDNPAFMETVAEKALQEYRQKHREE
uniref:Clusterin n=1 Tax=Rousettus aegyptiacus TaxID=9407 RepID=A0A7J8BQI6_ROUAE|nr:clusterin [Rousettus aegyptiacus]